MHLTREEYRLIKSLNREEMEEYLEIREIEREKIRKEALLDARQALEKAICIKGLGLVRKAEIRKRYREEMEEKEYGRREKRVT